MPAAARCPSVRVDLLRHGETALSGFCGRIDTKLTRQGRFQMHVATRHGGPWDAIVTSPLRRCASFAEALAVETRLSIEYEPRFAEYHFGQWEGRTAEQIWCEEPASLDRFWRDPWQFTPPGAQAMESFATRVAQGWDDLLGRHAGRRILLVTHAGVIRMVWHLCGRLPRRDFLRMQVGHASLHALVVPATKGVT